MIKEDKKQFFKILLSPIGLPTRSIGSWTNRIQRFQEKTGYFDRIISPTPSPDQLHVFAEKRQPGKLLKLFLRNDLQAFRYRKFLDAVLSFGSLSQPLQILVMDDKNLLEALVSIKPNLPKHSEIIFSFHGHRLLLGPYLADRVDKVLFLTKRGYLESFEANHQHPPLSFVVGNGVRSDLFFPLSRSEKRKQREELGFSVDNPIIIWMANSRPVKGFHLFKKVIAVLLKKYPNLQILSIGHEPDESISYPNWHQLGKVPNEKLPKYLQIGDFYFFTSLWQEGFGLSLAEAVKCGNFALASNAGGIPDVVSGCPFAELVMEPNSISSWVDTFDKLLTKKSSNTISDEEMRGWLSNWHDYQAWERNYLYALES